MNDRRALRFSRFSITPAISNSYSINHFPSTVLAKTVIMDTEKGVPMNKTHSPAVIIFISACLLFLTACEQGSDQENNSEPDAGENDAAAGKQEADSGSDKEEIPPLFRWISAYSSRKMSRSLSPLDRRLEGITLSLSNPNFLHTETMLEGKGGPANGDM